ncbi:hypothetical protein JMUB3936_1334 [Leptotrichia wadei]|uniref:Uncharacterized protein n=1 Tax=Leptotrichia wadei TaxID=157687 RepID=A0A510KTJ6_9FUSO|nr:hypothetical protein JMUB3936_1334 [Leptotrichia wadei]
MRALYNKTGGKQVSKYKVGFYVNSRANIYSTNAEVIDLVEDWKRMDQ